MVIGVPKEIKTLEHRVALIPSGAATLTKRGHRVLIEKGAGVGSGFDDDAYIAAGAEVAERAADVFSAADMIVKVKEPLPEEFKYIRKGQIVFTFFHFASCESLTKNIRDTGCIAIAYETIEDTSKGLPILAPMSEIAGRLSIQTGAAFLQKTNGGRGVLLGGVPGVRPANVVVIGAGAVGVNAAKMAAGLGGHVFLLDVNLGRLRHLSNIMPANVTELYSKSDTIEELVAGADLVVSGVLIPGAKAPKLITRDILKTMKSGSVIVDVCIDQGGSLETSRPTTQTNPIYEEEGVIHYCVTNMPAAVPVTSTMALTNATFPYILKLANQDINSIYKDPELASGVNMAYGQITYPAVAATFDLEFNSLESVFSNR